MPLEGICKYISLYNENANELLNNTTAEIEVSISEIQMNISRKEVRAARNAERPLWVLNMNIWRIQVIYQKISTLSKRFVPV